MNIQEATPLILKAKENALHILRNSQIPGECKQLLEPYLKYSVRITTSRAKEPLPIGSTKFGGHPHLPPSLPWPVSQEDGWAMPFICQLNLAEIRPWDHENFLPDHGWLYFFETQYEGWCVYFFDGSVEELEIRQAYNPELSSELWYDGEFEVYRECIPHFHPEWMLADYEPSGWHSLIEEKYELGDANRVYDDIKDSLREMLPSMRQYHRLFGYEHLGHCLENWDLQLLLEVDCDDNMDLDMNRFAQFFINTKSDDPLRNIKHILYFS